MGRQPFLKKYPNGGASLGPGFLEQRPAAASAIARCITLWSEVEFQYALLLAGILRTDSKAAVAIFNSLRRARTQREIINTAARAKFPEHSDLVTAVLKIGERLEKERVNLAHGLFGVTDASRDGVLWLNAEHRALHSVELSLKAFETQRSLTSEDFRQLMEKVFVYELEDLDEIAKNIGNYHGVVRTLVALVVKEDQKDRDHLDRQLREEPDVAEALVQANK